MKIGFLVKKLTAETHDYFDIFRIFVVKIRTKIWIRSFYYYLCSIRFRIERCEKQ